MMTATQSAHEKKTECTPKEGRRIQGLSAALDAKKEEFPPRCHFEEALRTKIVGQDEGRASAC